LITEHACPADTISDLHRSRSRVNSDVVSRNPRNNHRPAIIAILQHVFQVDETRKTVYYQGLPVLPHVSFDCVKRGQISTGIDTEGRPCRAANHYDVVEAV
jgi:hypothetical protein